MSRLTRYARMSMAAAVLLWSGAAVASSEKQSGHQPAKPAAAKPAAAATHEPAAAGGHEPAKAATGHDKPAAEPAAKPAAHGPAAEKPAAAGHGKPAPAGDPAPAAEHAEATPKPAAAPGARRKPAPRDAEASAREVVRRIETIMADAVKPAPSKDAPQAHRPAASAARRPAPPVHLAKPAPLLIWDAGLAPGNVTLVWDFELAPAGTAPGRAGVLLSWPVGETKPPIK